MTPESGIMDDGKQHIALPLVTHEDACLPIAINAVARYWDVDLSGESKKASLRYPGVGSAILAESISIARRHGLECRVLHGDMDRLQKLVDSAIPPVVIIPGANDSLRFVSAIMGYDSGQGLIMHYVPKQDKDSMYMGEIPSEKFDAMWRQESRLMIIMAPPDVMPDAGGDEHEANLLLLDAERHAIMGDIGEAGRLVRRALEADPGNVTALYMMASHLNEQGSPDCVQYYKKCLAANPALFSACRGLGNHYLKNKQYDTAERCYTDAIAIDPRRYGPVYKNRAVARLGRDDKQGAKSDLMLYLEHTRAAPDAADIKQAISEM